MEVLRISRDFSIGLLIFAAFAIVTMADALAAPHVIGTDAVLQVSPWLMTTLGLLFSAMLAFGLWFYRHLMRSMRQAPANRRRW
ncbi:MAG: hypothetical protein RLZ98_1800 [Pseudomonadota bacterium]